MANFQSSPITLIEKDYYCSLILNYFFNGDTSLVFKGGTCLSKVYVDFYRLSEDLDLIITVSFVAMYLPGLFEE